MGEGSGVRGRGIPVASLVLLWVPDIRLAVLGVSLLVALIAVARLVGAAQRLRWVDRAGEDPLKIHGGETPVLGGLGMAAGTLAGLALAAVLIPTLGLFPWILLAAGLGACALGLRDDLAGLRPIVRLAIEAGLGLAVGAALATWSNLGGRILPDLPAAAVLALGVVYTVGAVNALNMQDGIDGLAGTLALLSSLGFAAATWYGPPAPPLLALAVAGAAAGFLVHNAPPASIFMGDNGSYFLGLLLGAEALLVFLYDPHPTNLAASVLLIGLPVFDAALAILRRLRRGVSPFAGDRDHLYDRLARRFPTRTVVALCALLQAALVLAGLSLLQIGR
jgi:UDP-GlcNAc:undecaprenyl-phosphate/decaprenyl-phosphate GlcNAc-1-phosphate transferase